MSLKKKTLGAFKWNAAEKCIVQGLNFVFAILMARMLVPEDFGLVAMVTVFAGFLGRFIDGGLSSALIYSRDANEADKSSIFWVNIGIGAVLSLALWLCAPLIARFYNNESLVVITSLLAINFFLGSTTPVQLALFRKELNFKKMFYARLWALTVSGVVGIVMAYTGYGVWSIVTRMLLMSSLFSLLLWLFSDWRPRLIFDLERLRTLLNYSLPLLGSSILSYVQKNLDSLIVGKYLGGGDLGIYNKSYQLMVFPGNQVTTMVGFVLFSSFSRFNHDKHRLWSAYVVVTKGILLFSIVMSLTIYFVSESFVVNVLGSQWVGAIAIIKIMALVGLIQPLERSVGTLFNSMGATGLAFKISVIATPVYLACIVVGALWGLRGVAVGVVVAIAGMAIPQLHFAVKLVDRTIVDLFLENWRIILSGCICFLVVTLLAELVGGTSRPAWLVAFPVVISGVMLALSRLLYRNDANTIFGLVRTALK